MEWQHGFWISAPFLQLQWVLELCKHCKYSQYNLKTSKWKAFANLWLLSQSTENLFMNYFLSEKPLFLKFQMMIRVLYLLIFLGHKIVWNEAYAVWWRHFNTFCTPLIISLILFGGPILQFVTCSQIHNLPGLCQCGVNCRTEALIRNELKVQNLHLGFQDPQSSGSSYLVWPVVDVGANHNSLSWILV